MHRDLHLEAIRWLDRRSFTALLLTNATLKQWTGSSPALTDGHVDEHRIRLEKASLTRSVNENGEIYTLVFLGGNEESAVSYTYDNLRTATEQIAVLAKSAYVVALDLDARCAGDSRLSLPDVLSATGHLQNTVVEHLRIVSNPGVPPLPTFDFRVSAYYRLITVVFGEVHAISFDSTGWYDFDEDDDLENELPVVNAFFDSVLERGITCIDFSNFRFTRPWGPPESVFSFCLRPMNGELEGRDRFVALLNFRGLTAASCEAFLNDVTKANASGSLLHNFELRFQIGFNPWNVFRHPKLQETPNNELTKVLVFNNQTLLEIELCVDSGPPTLAIKYKKKGSSTP